MIYHPNLAYIARDYGLEEVAVEFEGKEPSPSRMKELIDLAVRENINTIFIQKEYDIRNARAIAAGTGGEIRIIDPLSEDWYRSVTDIIDGLYTSLTSSGK
jgi:zinc transport system substrate-binding protein